MLCWPAFSFPMLAGCGIYRFRIHTALIFSAEHEHSARQSALWPTRSASSSVILTSPDQGSLDGSCWSPCLGANHPLHHQHMLTVAVPQAAKGKGKVEGCYINPAIGHPKAQSPALERVPPPLMWSFCLDALGQWRGTLPFSVWT